MDIDQNNKQQLQAYQLIETTGSSFFLTGKAGTGKTTFLKTVQKEINKNFIVLAPTGIAAMLVGGETIHSFFGLPLQICTPKTVGNINSSKIHIIRKVDTIIIDEISMVRCDIIDAIDYTLRCVMRSSMPFGGKQMVFVGDLFQLPPVLRSDEEEIMDDLYQTQTPYFFKAKVLKKLALPCIEFNKVYRQEDMTFLNILNSIRYNRISYPELAMLNQRVCRNAPPNERIITLCARNDEAARINNSRLQLLKSEEFLFEAKIEGEIKQDGNLPADRKLALRVGAQIIFVRNDPSRRWVNGTLGTISKLTQNDIYIETTDGEYKVDPVSWESYKYEYNSKEKKIQKTLVGTYTQYPIKLSWAITIHKSQGMTFDKMILDLSRGVFSKGQLYVALSRVRDLEGLYLVKPVSFGHIGTSEEILAFADKYNNDDLINEELYAGHKVYKAFREKDWDKVAQLSLNLCHDYIVKGDWRTAARYAAQMFNVMVSDHHLLNTLNVDINRLSPSSDVLVEYLNATICLYSGHYREAIGYCDGLLQKRSCKDALFIKARSLKLLGRYSEADDVNIELAKQLDGEFDAKIYYEVSLLNELHLGDPGLDIMQSVVKARPEYNQSIIMLRKLKMKKEISLKTNEDTANSLVDLFNSNVDDKLFVDKLEEYRKKDKGNLESFIKLLSSVRF